jgi:hypothetical protein
VKRLHVLVFISTIGLGSMVRAELVSLYTFDGTTGNAVRHAPDGWLSGGRKYVPGMLGKALAFDGTTSIDATPLGLPTIRAGLATGSLSCWIATTTAEQEPLIGAANTGNAQSFAVEVNGNAAGRKALGGIHVFLRSASDGSGALLFGAEHPDIWRDGNWRHIVVTWDITAGSPGTGAGAIYIDGVAQSITIASTSIVSARTFGDWNNPMRIGNWDRQRPAPPYYHGTLDDVGIWDHQLTGVEVKTLYCLATNRAIRYNARDAQDLLDIFAGGPGTQGLAGDGRMWKYAEGLSGSPGDVINHDSAVVLDRNGRGVVAVTEPLAARPENTR